MEIIQLPTEPFCVADLKSLFKNGTLKDHLDAVNYVKQYYFEIKCGMYYFYNVEAQTFEFRDKKDFQNEVLKKVGNSKEFNKHFDENEIIFSLVAKIDKPRLYKSGKNYYINECFGLLHKTYKQYDEYSEDIKKKVQMILDMMKEISCKNNEEVFKAYIKYYAQIARGMKTEVIIYRKSEEGIGKSTETEFIMKYVYGEKVSLISGTEPLLTAYNKIYFGKLFIVFEELPTMTEGQWNCASGRLKTFTTEKKTMFRDVYEKAVEGDLIANFQINTNVEALKSSDGRRIIFLDLNQSRMGDYDFFSSIKRNCFNNAVGEAFFSYLMTRITDEEANKFYCQKDFPITDNKSIAKANLLHSVHKFLKNRLLENNEISKIPPSELLENYVDFCELEKLRPVGRNDFYKRLEDIGIIRDKSNGDHYYTVSTTKLIELSKKYNWICKFDEYTTPSTGYGFNNNPAIDGKTKREVELEQEIAKLRKQLEQLSKPKKEEVNDYKEVFIKPPTDDDLEAEFSGLTSTEQKPNKNIIDDVDSLDDLRNIEAQLKKQKKNKKV